MLQSTQHRAKSSRLYCDRRLHRLKVKSRRSASLIFLVQMKSTSLSLSLSLSHAGLEIRFPRCKTPACPIMDDVIHCVELRFLQRIAGAGGEGGDEMVGTEVPRECRVIFVSTTFARFFSNASGDSACSVFEDAFRLPLRREKERKREREREREGGGERSGKPVSSVHS